MKLVFQGLLSAYTDCAPCSVHSKCSRALWKMGCSLWSRYQRLTRVPQTEGCE